MQMIIIAGQAGVGKTTLAHLIAKRVFDLGLSPVMLSFASSLKTMAKERGYDKKSNPEKYRQFCQSLGASKRAENEDYWVNLFEDEVSSIFEKEQKDLKKNVKYWERCIIVDDCRYANEIRTGIKHGATMIFLSYGGRDPIYGGNEWMQHESEEMAALVEDSPNKFSDVFDYIIDNDGQLEDLEGLVMDMAEYWCNLKQQDENYKKISQCVSELIDLLLLSEISGVEEEEDEDEDDETVP